jgi:type II secretory pathway pseudopilin PulG
MTIDQRNSIISIILSIVIIGLSYVLYDSIVTPYQTRLAEIETETRVRERMTSIRDALIAYQRDKGKYPPSLDSIQVFLETNSRMIAGRDTLFVTPLNPTFDLATFLNSPRSNTRFEYTLNDTLRPMIYLLKDPDSEDVIGSLERTTRLNAPSWD